MALISSQLQWLDQALSDAQEECGQVVDQNHDWLKETIEANVKNLQYKMCARTHGPGVGGRVRELCSDPMMSSRPRRNPVLECPRSQRKPPRKGRKKFMATLAVRSPPARRV